MRRMIIGRCVILGLLCVACSALHAQIDLEKGTAQAITYWNMGESQDYTVTETDVSIHAADTTSAAVVSYDVNIKVVDSTSVGYVLEWTRNNYQSSSSDTLLTGLVKLIEGYPLLISINEYGGDHQLINWEDLGAHVSGKLDKLGQRYTSEVGKSKIKKEAAKYQSKETIQELAMHDVVQFFAYHGAKYQLGETIKTYIKVPNNYGGDPLDASTAMVLDEIIPGNDTYIIKTFININPQQLTAVTYDYLTKLDIVGADLPSFEDFPTVMKQIWGGSEIHGGSGWIVYSQESQQVTNGEDVTITERLIELVR